MILNRKVFAFIFARGGSKGILGKNIRELDGKPLIGWSIDIAKSIKIIDDIYVSTDSDQIKNVAITFDVNIINRPNELATDTSNEWDAWQQAVSVLIDRKEANSEDIFISLPATSPLRNSKDVVSALLDFDPNKLDILITAKESSRSPYFNIIKENAEGFCEKLIATNYVRRQDVPKTYDMTTVFYITTFRNILNASSVFSGRVGLFEVDQISALDIDTEFDLRMAEFFLKEKKNNEESK